METWLPHKVPGASATGGATKTADPSTPYDLRHTLFDKQVVGSSLWSTAGGWEPPGSMRPSHWQRLPEIDDETGQRVDPGRTGTLRLSADFDRIWGCLIMFSLPGLGFRGRCWVGVNSKPVVNGPYADLELSRQYATTSLYCYWVRLH
jgi:hypothetical protein